jgi:hypothetical protein
MNSHPSNFKNNNPASELTREHYERPEVQSILLDLCALSANSKDGYRWIVGGSTGWYDKKDGKYYGNRGDQAHYNKVIQKFRTIHYTTGFFNSEVFNTDFSDMHNDEGEEEDGNFFSKRNCVGMSALFDIDTKDEVNGHGANIELPKAKAAVEKMVKFICDDLKKYAPGYYCAAFSGGGAYVLLHHSVFQEFIDECAGTEKQIERMISLSSALNHYLLIVEQKFKEEYPDESQYVKLDRLNQPKRMVKALLSIHKKKPYAVIPLDPEKPIIDFEAARLPLSDEVIQRCKNWYKAGTAKPEFVPMLETLMVQLKKEGKLSKVYDYEPFETPEIQEIPGTEKFPPCMKSLINRPYGGEGQTRALGQLAAFLGEIGWEKKEAYDLWITVAKRWKAETANIFDSWFRRMHCAGCKKIMSEGEAYPFINLAPFLLCKPDIRCLKRKMSSPKYVASEELYLQSFKKVRV